MRSFSPQLAAETSTTQPCLGWLLILEILCTSSAKRPPMPASQRVANHQAVARARWSLAGFAPQENTRPRVGAPKGPAGRTHGTRALSILTEVGWTGSACLSIPTRPPPSPNPPRFFFSDPGLPDWAGWVGGGTARTDHWISHTFPRVSGVPDARGVCRAPSFNAAVREETSRHTLNKRCRPHRGQQAVSEKTAGGSWGRRVTRALKIRPGLTHLPETEPPQVPVGT